MRVESAPHPNDRWPPMPLGASSRSPARRRVRYAVAWQEGDGVVTRGSATIDEDDLVLRASGERGSGVSLHIELRQVADLRIGRSERDRVRGERSVVIELVGGEIVSIAPLGAPGAVFELADLIAARGRRDRPRDAR